METTTAELSDDWQHVDDSDTFSVISLPMSEDDALSSSLVQISSSPPHDLIHPAPQSERLAQNGSHSPHVKEALDKNQVLNGHDVDMADAVQPDHPQPQSGEMVKKPVGMESLCERLGSQVKLLSDVMSTVSRGLCHPPAVEITTQCEILRSRLMCLQDILYAYTKRREVGSTYAEHPIDPGLSQWLCNLESELLGLQAMFKEPRITGVWASIAATAWALRVKDHHEQLESLTRQLNGLMAAVRSDYADVHPSQQPTPSTSHGKSCTHPKAPRRPFSGAAAGAGASIFHLRRTLYALRDQIVTFLNEIYSCERHGISLDLDQHTNMRASTLRFKKIKESLELMLSNTGSSWIDYSLAGGLTYQDFCRLNPDTIRSLVFQLKEVTDELFHERCRAQSLHYGYGPDGSIHDENLVIKESSMDMLRTIDGTLSSILQIRTDQ